MVDVLAPAIVSDVFGYKGRNGDPERFTRGNNSNQNKSHSDV